MTFLLAQVPMYPLHFVGSWLSPGDDMTSVDLEWMDGPHKGQHYTVKWEQEALEKRLDEINIETEPFIYLSVHSENIFSFNRAKTAEAA